MIADFALEANRRVAWAAYYSKRAQLETERLHSAELAVWIEVLDLALPSDDGPLRQLVNAKIAAVDPFDLARIRRYVQHNSGVHHA